MNYNAREYVATLSDATRRSILRDFDTLEKNGSIGDCDLRAHAEKITPPGGHVVWIMRDLAFECYRHFSSIVLDMVVDPRARIKELETALKTIRAAARFEQQHPTGLHMTCLSIIERDANLALAGCDTYDMEIEEQR